MNGSFVYFFTTNDFKFHYEQYIKISFKKYGNKKVISNIEIVEACLNLI